MKISYIIGDPETYYLSQRDNALHPTLTCFPTSVAMVITYILQQHYLDKTIIGIPNDMQIEDYITQLITTNK